tara:strand:+ start:344 stop:1564 length:1221 start_codon:yes stop_codon:yes gene_type:complete
MRKVYIKVTFILFLIFLYGVISFGSLLFSFEYLNISKYFNNKFFNVHGKINFLYETDYYIKGGLKKSPYHEFSRQILHPHYIFSTPHNFEEIKKINNKYVSLNKTGFRNSINFDQKNKNIIFLGGSVAFGSSASSDETTIPSFIAQYTDYNVINKGIPSWNSHQELISLIKNRNKYEYSISLSGSNDWSITCSNYFYYGNILDIPESFHLLSNYFYDVRGETIISKKQKIKIFLVHNFPETKRLYKNVLKAFDRYYFKKNIEKLDYNSNEIKICGGEGNIDKVADNFIHNQKMMRKISNQSNAKHWLVIQPMLPVHISKTNGENDDPDTKGRKYFIDRIMKSDFCKLNCLDYSDIFNKLNLNGLKLYSSKKEKNWPKETIFTDRFHLTDIGNKIFTKKLIEDIQLN